MEYYLLSVWKKDGRNSYSLCCSTSDNIHDLIHNMAMYIIKEDEVFVISHIENGNERNEGGNVVENTYYDGAKRETEVNSEVNRIIIDSINNILSL